MQECHKGVQFIGAIVKPNRIYCSNRSIAKFYSKIKNIKIVDERTIATINSYLGLMGHYCTYHIRKRLIQNLSVIFGRGFRKVKLNKNLNYHD